MQSGGLASAGRPGSGKFASSPLCGTVSARGTAQPLRPSPPPCPQAHIALYLHQNFVDCVEAAAGQRSITAPVAAALRSVVALHGVVLLLEASGDLLEGGYCSGEGWGWLGGWRGVVRWGWEVLLTTQGKAAQLPCDLFYLPRLLQVARWQCCGSSSACWCASCAPTLWPW